MKLTCRRQFLLQKIVHVGVWPILELIQKNEFPGCVLRIINDISLQTRFVSSVFFLALIEDILRICYQSMIQCPVTLTPQHGD